MLNLYNEPCSKKDKSVQKGPCPTPNNMPKRPTTQSLNKIAVLSHVNASSASSNWAVPGGPHYLTSVVMLLNRSSKTLIRSSSSSFCTRRVSRTACSLSSWRFITSI